MQHNFSRKELKNVKKPTMCTYAYNQQKKLFAHNYTTRRDKKRKSSQK